MIVSDKRSENKIFDSYEDAEKYFKKTNGYAIINFRIYSLKFWMVTYE
jgi:hypothetical protein